MAEARPERALSAPSVGSLGFPSAKTVPFTEQAESFGPLCPRTWHRHGEEVRTGDARVGKHSGPDRPLGEQPALGRGAGVGLGGISHMGLIVQPLRGLFKKNTLPKCF